MASASAPPPPTAHKGNAKRMLACGANDRAYRLDDIAPPDVSATGAAIFRLELAPRKAGRGGGLRGRHRTVSASLCLGAIAHRQPAVELAQRLLEVAEAAARR